MKFDDKDHFTIEYNDPSGITISSKTNSTIICFELKRGENILKDFRYFNKTVNGYGGESYSEENKKSRMLDQVNLDRINNLLEVPLFKGWTTIDKSSGKIYLSSVAFEGKSKE